MSKQVQVMDRAGQAIASLSRAENMLASADTIVDILDVRDRARAIEELAKIAGATWEVEQRATIVRLKAERKAGAWLAEHVPHNGGRPSNGTVVLDDLGVTKSQSHRWQMIAKVPEDRFVGWIDDHMAKGHDLSAAGLMRYAGNVSGDKTPTRNGLWLAAPAGICDLQGYKIRCAGGLEGHHIINKTLARGNEEVREILVACPPEVMSKICEAHNVGRWADQHEARRILLLQKVWQFGLEHMREWVNGLPWKVEHLDLRFEAMMEAKG